MVEIYARDLAKDKQTDAFMGAGFEDALAKAEETGEDLVVGEFCENSQWRIN